MKTSLNQKIIIAIISAASLVFLALTGIKVLVLFLALAAAFSGLVYLYFHTNEPLPGGGCSSGVCSTEVDEEDSGSGKCGGGCSSKNNSDDESMARAKYPIRLEGGRKS